MDRTFGSVCGGVEDAVLALAHSQVLMILSQWFRNVHFKTDESQNS